jgi:predicted RNA-binding protein YlxR (DUF448 family)
MPKKSKKLKIPRQIAVKIAEGLPPDTSRDRTGRGAYISRAVGGKELKIDKELDKKKQIKEKDVFDFAKK